MSKKLSVKSATETVLIAVLDQKHKGMRSLIHPRNPIKIVTESGQCDSDVDGDCTSTQLVVGQAAFSKVADGWLALDAAPTKCDKKCCELDGEEPQGASTGLDKICFARDSGGVLTLTRFEVIDNP